MEENNLFAAGGSTLLICVPFAVGYVPPEPAIGRACRQRGLDFGEVSFFHHFEILE